jgi:hypothetical protein
MQYVPEQLRGSIEMKRVIKDKAKFTKVSTKVIGERFCFNEFNETMDLRRRYWKDVFFSNFR